MENASKALLMVAGVLIGILIISLAVYLFVSFGTTSAEAHKQIDSDRITQFNTQFTSFEGKDNVTIYDVVTVANLATENNKSYELPKVSGIINNTNYPNFYVQVTLKNDNYNTSIEGGYNSNDIDYNTIIENDSSKISEGKINLDKYNCKTYISKVTRKGI